MSDGRVDVPVVNIHDDPLHSVEVYILTKAETMENLIELQISLTIGFMLQVVVEDCSDFALGI
ncbi:hypothetical protein CFIMG_007167RA [Ceratocystis fimbriata CBS 114723]|uniref:Uncharacterized protein n=1 Tax=Ceratocystis fimbriata CBS 114723 TaxID=1035309 RepID=A0A2C5WTI7_9PEZI|nr:hypothetical protein CFIMG_007167RA [Ceratocystis fimbriata CBS 114723]